MTLIRMLPLALTLGLPTALAAQADSAAAAPAAPQVAATSSALGRRNWYSDRQPLKVGDLVTVQVVESAQASENVSRSAKNDRSQVHTLNTGLDATVGLGPNKGFNTGATASSTDQGSAGRNNSFSTVITVQVKELDAIGNAKIAGNFSVDVDGRTQDVTLEGTIRPNDITADNVVTSERIFDKRVTYKGKDIKPRQGILGKILGIFWP